MFVELNHRYIVSILPVLGHLIVEIEGSQVGDIASFEVIDGL